MKKIVTGALCLMFLCSMVYAFSTKDMVARKGIFRDSRYRRLTTTTTRPPVRGSGSPAEVREELRRDRLVRREIIPLLASNRGASIAEECHRLYLLFGPLAGDYADGSAPASSIVASGRFGRHNKIIRYTQRLARWLGMLDRYTFLNDRIRLPRDSGYTNFITKVRADRAWVEESYNWSCWFKDVQNEAFLRDYRLNRELALEDGRDMPEEPNLDYLWRISRTMIVGEIGSRGTREMFPDIETWNGYCEFMSNKMEELKNEYVSYSVQLGGTAPDFSKIDWGW